MLDDPLRAQSFSLVAGCVLAVIAVAVCAVAALVRPQGVPDSAIVIARDSGALFVRIGDTLHPVPNLASARLVARSASNPAPASDAAIAAAKRGPLVGIPGAPATIGRPLGEQSWSVCDDERTVVVVGDAGFEGFDTTAAVLVTPHGESAAITYLLYDGQRAEVDLRNVAVVRALHLEGVEPLPVSRVLLDIVPEVPPIVAPRIDGVGEAGPPALGDNAVGTIVRVLRAGGTEYYVVVRNGIQAVGEIAADVIRFTYDGRTQTVPAVSPTVIARTPVASTLPVDTYPRRAGTTLGAGTGAVVCAQWRQDAASDSSYTAVLTGRPARRQPWRSIDLAQADGDGPNVDAVAMDAGRIAYVRSARVAGDDGATGPRFLVTDLGVVHGIRDDDAAKFLGLQEPPVAAPWPILAHLPGGPELSIDAASVTRDGMAPPP